MGTDMLNKIEIRYKVTFCSSLIFGFLSQGMGLFNKFSYHDDIGNFGVGATVTSGRWMLGVLSKLEILIYGDGHYSLPLFNGVLSLLFIALAACLIVALLDVKSVFSTVIIGGIMSVFPVITSLFGYAFTIHFYMLSLLFGVTGVFLLLKKTKAWSIFIGILLISCSIGIYQAFLPFTLTIILVFLIKQILNEQFQAKQFLKKILFVFISVISFMALYFICNKLVLNIKGAELSSYKGIDDMGKLPISEYLKRSFLSYKLFFGPDANSEYFMYPGRIYLLYKIVICLSTLFTVVIAYRLMLVCKLQAFCFLVMSFFIPLSVNFIFVMTGETEVHSLMVYSQLFPFIYICFLYEQLDVKGIFVKYLSSILKVILSVILLMYCRYDSKCYLKAVYTQQEAICYFNTLITQIKSTKNYSDELPIVFINSRNNTDKSITAINELSDIKLIPYDSLDDYLNNYLWQRYMAVWCGFSPEILKESEITITEEIKSMPSYPDSGSIQIVNNTVVVKL